MIQLPTSSTGVRFPGHRHRPSVGEGGLVGVKGPKWPSLGRSSTGESQEAWWLEGISCEPGLHIEFWSFVHRPSLCWHEKAQTKTYEFNVNH